MRPVAFLLLLGLLSFWAGLTVATRPAHCNLPPDYGGCRGYVTRYYYNPTSNRCETFTYSGCTGNGNNFQSQYACHYSCIEKPGRCPSPPPNTGTICPVHCYDDWGCTGSQKCCHYGCIIQCMNPV